MQHIPRSSKKNNIMRQVFVAEEFALLRLIAFPVAASELHVQLREELFLAIVQRQWDVAKQSAERLYESAWQSRDRHVAALARLYLADLYRRQEKSLRVQKTPLQFSLNWLKIEVTYEARYNEALAWYALGLLYYCNARDKNADGAFNRALQLLHEVSAFWEYQSSPTLLADCQRLQQWITNLLILADVFKQNPESVIAPVYEYAPQNTLTFCGAIDIDPREYILPENILVADDSKSRITAASFPPEAHYFVVKINHPGELIPESQVNDLIVVKKLATLEPAKDTATQLYGPFGRKLNGRVVRLLAQEKFVGELQALIRGGKYHD